MGGERPPFVQLKSVATIRPGVNKPKEAMGSGVRYVTVKDLYDGTSIRPESLPRVELSQAEIERFSLSPGDIVICKSSVKRDGIGYPSRFLGFSEPVVYSGFTACVRSFPEETCAEYLFQTLRWSQTRRWLINHSQRSAITNLNRSIMESIPVPIVSLPEQRKIAAILSSVDDAIEKTRAVINQVQMVTRGLIEEQFFKVFETHHHSPVAAEWRLLTLGVVAKVQGGFPFQSKNFRDSGVPVVRMTNLRDGSLNLTNAVCVSLETVAELDRFRLRAGDLLLAARGESPH